MQKLRSRSSLPKLEWNFALKKKKYPDSQAIRKTWANTHTPSASLAEEKWVTSVPLRRRVAGIILAEAPLSSSDHCIQWSRNVPWAPSVCKGLFYMLMRPQGLQGRWTSPQKMWHLFGGISITQGLPFCEASSSQEGPEHSLLIPTMLLQRPLCT